MSRSFPSLTLAENDRIPHSSDPMTQSSDRSRAERQAHVHGISMTLVRPGRFRPIVSDSLLVTPSSRRSAARFHFLQAAEALTRWINTTMLERNKTREEKQHASGIFISPSSDTCTSSRNPSAIELDLLLSSTAIHAHSYVIPSIGGRRYVNILTELSSSSFRGRA